MATLTIRLPDAKHDRLKSLAKSKKISMNKLFEEFTTQAIAEFDSESRFRSLAAKGSAKKGLQILDILDEKSGS